MRNAERLNNKYKDDDFYITLCNKLTDLTDKTIANIKSKVFILKVVF